MFWWDSTTSSPVLGFIFLRGDGWKKEPRKVDECTWRDRITVTNIKHCRRHQPRTIWHMVEIKTTQVVWINSENYKSYGGSPINISKQSSEDERFLIRVWEERDLCLSSCFMFPAVEWHILRIRFYCCPQDPLSFPQTTAFALHFDTICVIHSFNTGSQPQRRKQVATIL